MSFTDLAGDVSLGQQQEPDITLSGPTSKPLLPQDVAESRALKFKFAVGNPGPSLESIRTSILSGDENAFREMVAASEDIRAAQAKNEFIIETAKKRGSALSFEEIQVIRDMTLGEIKSDPDTILEKKFAEQYTSGIASRALDDPENLYTKALTEDTPGTLDSLDATQNIVQKGQIFRTVLQDLEAEAEKRGLISKVWDFTKQILPGVTAVNFARSLSNETVSALNLPGSTLGDAVKYLWALPPEMAKAELKRMVDTAKEINIDDAILIARAAVAYTSSEELLGNLIGAADLTTLAAPIIKGAGRLARGAVGSKIVKEDLKESLKTTVRASQEHTVEDILAGSGDVAKSAEIVWLKSANAEDAKAILERTPSLINPGRFLNTGAAITSGRVAHLTQRAEAANKKLMDLLEQGVHVPRTTQEELKAGVTSTINTILKNYRSRVETFVDGSEIRVGDGIMNVSYLPAEANLASVDTVFLNLGRAEGDNVALPFASRVEAERYYRDVYQLSPGEGRVVPWGDKFVISIPKTVDETVDAVRETAVTPKNTTPVSLTNMLLNRVRAYDDLVSKEQSERRKLAVHAPQGLTKMIVDQYRETSKALSHKQRDAVETMLRLNRDEVVNGQRGKFYETADEFEKAYFDKFNRPPKEAEVEHYFNYTRLSDFDWYIRNLARYRDKARKGVEQYGLTVRGETTYFEGKILESLPSKGDDAGVYVFDSQTGAGGFFYKNDNETMLEGLVRGEGYKVIQLHSPLKRPLKEITERSDGQPLQDVVHFVLTKQHERKALSWEQVDYRPGGHSIYRDEWYIGQPVLRKGSKGREFYYGDKLAMNFATRAEAEKYIQHIEKARDLMFHQSPHLGDYLSKNLPFSEKDFRAMFMKEDGFSMEIPFRVKQQGKDIFGTDPELKRAHPNAVHSSKNQWDMSAYDDLSYTADRDLVLNSVDESVWRVAPSRQLDPYEALNKGFGQSIRNLWMTDYKIGAVDSWLKEFGHLMEPDDPKKVFNAPLYYLYKKLENPTADRAQLAAARTQQRAIVNLIHQRSEIARDLDFVHEKLADSMYSVFGQNVARKTADVGIPFLKDPGSYFRSIAFHKSLGLFNPVQLLVQAQIMTHAIGVAGPQRGYQGVVGGVLFRYGPGINPNMLDATAKMASRMGYGTADEFKEMAELLQKSNLRHVGGETAMRDDFFDPKIVRSSLKNFFLDKGPIFFNEGERLGRITAFATAYKEFRAANPTKTIGNRELAEIMDRSDLLTANMTRKSVSDIQQGVFSPTLQFTTFQKHLMEQFLGNRLTPVEKARAIAVYSAFYGIPTGVLGTTVGVYPWAEDIRTHGLANGVDVSSTFERAALGGLAAIIPSIILGKDYEAGRFGPGGLPQIRDLLRGDKPTLEILGGPSAGIVSQILQSAAPLTKSTMSLFMNGGKEHPFVAEDFLDVMKESASSFALASKVAAVWAYGKYRTKNNTLVSEGLDTVDAFAIGLGLTPQQIHDTYLLRGKSKDDHKVKEDYERAALREFSFGYQALAEGDEKKYRKHMARVSSIVDSGVFNPQDRVRIGREAVKYSEALEHRIRDDFVFKAPDEAYLKRYKAWIRDMQRKQ